MTTPVSGNAEIHDDERAETAIGVLRRAVSWFAARSVTVEWVRSDDARVGRRRALSSPRCRGSRVRPQRRNPAGLFLSSPAAASALDRNCPDARNRCRLCGVGTRRVGRSGRDHRHHRRRCSGHGGPPSSGRRPSCGGPRLLGAGVDGDHAGQLVAPATPRADGCAHGTVAERESVTLHTDELPIDADLAASLVRKERPEWAELPPNVTRLRGRARSRRADLAARPRLGHRRRDQRHPGLLGHLPGVRRRVPRMARGDPRLRRAVTSAKEPRETDRNRVIRRGRSGAPSPTRRQ